MIRSAKVEIEQILQIGEKKFKKAKQTTERMGKRGVCETLCQVLMKVQASFPTRVFFTLTWPIKL